MYANFLITTCLLHCGFAISPHEQIAKVEVIKRRARSATSPAEDYDFDVGVSSGGTTHRLKLRSAGKILSSNFKYHEVELDDAGQTIFRDLTPSTRRLREIQRRVYIDASKNTAVRLKQMDGDGEFEFELNGLVNGFRIRRQDGEHVIEESIPTSGPNHTDYEIIDRPMIQGRGMLMNGVMHATPEIAVVFDYANSKHFNFDRDQIIDYLVVLFNAVNNRYSLNEDPKITCQLVGVHVIKSLDAQPFINNGKSKIKRGKYNMEEVLVKYGEWAFQNAELLPKHDIAPLISGVEFDSVVIGLAPLNGACYFDMNRKRNVATPVAHDSEGRFIGAWTTAHELAHNMGAPHDGELTSTACPWSGGYLMSYEGWGTDNKFKLSKCSQEAMKKFIGSSGGACLLMKTQGLKVLKASTKEVGDIMDMKKICEHLLRDKSATPLFQQDADESCRHVKCKLVSKSGRIRQSMSTRPPGNNAPCGEGGKCQNGRCVGQKVGVLLTMNQLCVKITDNENATVYYEDPNKQCHKGFKCRVGKKDGHYSIWGGVKPQEGTVCGEGGKCTNGICIGQTFLSMDQMCLKIAKDNTATIKYEDPNVQCNERI